MNVTETPTSSERERERGLIKREVKLLFHVSHEHEGKTHYKKHFYRDFNTIIL